MTSRVYGARDARSPLSHYDVILTVTSFATELATPTVTDEQTYEHLTAFIKTTNELIIATQSRKRCGALYIVCEVMAQQSTKLDGWRNVFSSRRKVRIFIVYLGTLGVRMWVENRLRFHAAFTDVFFLPISVTFSTFMFFISTFFFFIYYITTIIILFAMSRPTWNTQ